MTKYPMIKLYGTVKSPNPVTPTKGGFQKLLNKHFLVSDIEISNLEFI